MLTVPDNNIYEHSDEEVPGSFYGSVHPFFFRFVDNREAQINKLVGNLQIDSEVFDPDGAFQRDDFFDTVRIYNTYQDTGDRTTVLHDRTGAGNLRFAQGQWRFHDIRDMTDKNGVLQQSKEWYEKDWLKDRYHYVELTYNNSSGNSIYLVAAGLGVKRSLR